METKQCTKCKVVKKLSVFKKYHAHGYVCTRSWCSDCKNKDGKEYRDARPWLITYSSIRQRIYNKNCDTYKNYKDVEFSMTIADLKNLYFRDKADLMKRPSIHRLDNNKGYIAGNCVYIEFDKHMKISSEARKKVKIGGRDGV